MLSSVKIPAIFRQEKPRPHTYAHRYSLKSDRQSISLWGGMSRLDAGDGRLWWSSPGQPTHRNRATTTSAIGDVSVLAGVAKKEAVVGVAMKSNNSHRRRVCQCRGHRQTSRVFLPRRRGGIKRTTSWRRLHRRERADLTTKGGKVSGIKMLTAKSRKPTTASSISTRRASAANHYPGDDISGNHRR